jgi:polysaccharide chain length determinant protein (PEP-CTERM system associated)
MPNAELELLKKAGRHAWRRAWWLLALQVVATLAGAAAFTLISKQYESTTTIRIESSQLINPLVRGLAVSSESEERIRSIREEILSRDYFDKITTRLGLEPPDSPPVHHEARIAQMIKNTTVATRQAGTFQIVYRGSDPKEVRDVTNLLAGIFIEASLSDKADEAAAAVGFLTGQLEAYRTKLEEAEAALRRFEERHLDDMPSNRAANLSRSEQLRATLVEVQANLRQARDQRDLLRRKTSPAGSFPEGTAEPGVLMVTNPLQAHLVEKEAELRQLLVDYSPTYPDVVALQAEIAGLRRELEQNPLVPASQAATSQEPSIQDALSLGQLQQLEMLVAALTTREQHVAQELARYEKKVQSVPEVEQELTRLRRDYDVNNDIYNSFLRRLEEAKVSRELEASKRGEVFRILQAATLPLTPVRPNRAKTVLGGVAAGLGLNALLLFLLAQHDTSIQSAEEAHKLLGLKVLAGIPRHRTKKESSRMVLKTALICAAGGVYVASVAAFLLWNRIAAAVWTGR